MPSMVSGDSFLRGFQASPLSLAFKAAFWARQSGLRGSKDCGERGSSAIVSILSGNESLAGFFSSRSFLAGAKALGLWVREKASSGRDEESGGLFRPWSEKNRNGCEDRRVCCCNPTPGSGFVKDRMNRLSVFRAQLLQCILRCCSSKIHVSTWMKSQASSSSVLSNAKTPQAAATIYLACSVTSTTKCQTVISALTIAITMYVYDSIWM